MERGLTADIPQELVIAGAVPFKGIHMWKGGPVKKTIALIQVKGVDALYRYVRKNGRDQISDIHESGASPQTCNITTLDGSILTFFE